MMLEHEMSEAPILGWAAILAGAAVAGADPEAREVNAPCWASSKAQYLEAAVGLAGAAAAARGGTLADLLADLEKGSDLREHYDALRMHLDNDDTSTATCQALRTSARRIGRQIRLLYFAKPGPLKSSVPLGPGPRESLGRVHILIPFRAREDVSLRPRNLSACLEALGAQAADGDMFDVTVVECDDRPRHRERFRDRVDDYRFVRDEGPFNKSLAVNSAAARLDAADDIVCVLDADILVEADFVTRLKAAVPENGALLPYEDAFCLDRASSDRAAAHAANGGALSAALDRAGYLIRHPPGGCIALTVRQFHAVGGFDTRFVGWGGEDRDLVDRVARHAAVERLPGLLTHLAHERPTMREEREEIMRHTLAPTEG